MAPCFSSFRSCFRHEIGLMTGMVGCAGGIGGFFLAKALGIAKAMTGGFGAGFVFFRPAGVAWVPGTCHGQGPLAYHMGRGIGSAGLTTSCYNVFDEVVTGSREETRHYKGLQPRVAIGSQRNLGVRVGFVSETGKRLRQ